MQHMFPVDVQEKISKLHLGYEAGLKIDGIKTISRTPIEAPSDLEEFVTAALEGNGHWTKDAVSFAKQYESIVDEANRNGAEIYDTCVTWFHGNPEYGITSVISDVVSLMKKNRLKVKITYGYNSSKLTGRVIPIKDDVLSHNGHNDRILFYTTTKGAELVKKVLQDHFDTARIQVSYYGLEVKTQPLLSQLLKHKAGRGEATALCSQALVMISDVKAAVSENGRQYELIGRVFAKRGSERVANEKHYVVQDTLGMPYYPINEALERAKMLKLNVSPLTKQRRYL